jgi:RHS repeat-associated protein
MRFEWNPAHQLVRSRVARGASSDTEQTVTYAYDPFGRRIAKRDAFGVTRFVWDGNRLLCEQRGSHARTYVYGEDAFVPLARVDAVAGSDGAARAEVRHLHTDHLGTPREMTDAGGRVVWAARYRAWGNVVEVVQENVLLSDENGDGQPVRFQGQYYDNESGLHYNRFRYYDPDIGRFVSIDPIGLAAGSNNYSYASNPVNYVDPFGLSPCRAGDADDLQRSTATPLLAIGEINGVGSVTRNALSDSEYLQAVDIVKFKGGHFEGAPSANFPGIDGWLNGTPVQLKEVTGKSLSAIQRNIIGGANDMAKQGYAGDLFIDATRTGVSMDQLTRFIKPGSPVSNVLNEGVVNNAYIKTSSGWLNITKGTIASTPKG